MSPRPRSNERHPDLQTAIKEAAWKQIAELGATALNLRGIARDLGIATPSIYNYFPNRDALVTALIIEAYTSFGDSQIEARDSVSATDLSRRLAAIGHAYRQWALTYPQRYGLIFGTPIPGYVAPILEVLPSAARSLNALVSVIDQLRLSGKLKADGFPSVQPGYEEQFEVWKKFAGDYDIFSLSVAMLIWSRVHGLVSLEVTQNMPPFGVDGGALYQYEIASIQKQFIKDKS